MDASERAYERVIRLLAGRSHSRAELLRKLRQRGIGKKAAEQAVERATREGYVDDGRFALEFARHSRSIKGWAPARVRQELGKRGVDRDLVDAALAEVYAEVDLLELAMTSRHGATDELTEKCIWVSRLAEETTVRLRRSRHRDGLRCRVCR